MPLDGLKSQTLSDFGGAWSDVDAPDVPLSKGLFARNLSYQDNVGTRFGFGQAFIPTAGTNAEFMTGMKNWISSLGNWLVWFNAVNGKVRGCNLTSPTSVSDLVATNMGQGYHPSWATDGSRLYVCTSSSAGVAGSHGRVISWQSAAWVSDTIAAPPMTYSGGTTSEPASGVVTAGVHKWGYRIEYRGGFFGKLCPVNASTEVFEPASFTATGSKNVRFTLNTLWPTGAIRVHIAITTISNQARFKSANASVAVVGGATSSVTVDVNLSDVEIDASTIDWTFSQSLWTQTIAGVAPFQPTVMQAYGDRMVYVTRITDGLGNFNSAAVISDPFQYQVFTALDNVVQLPGRTDFVTVKPHGGSLYFFGPNGTHVTADNGDLPQTWKPAETVDTRRGTLAFRGVELAPSGDFLWVADTDGLYLFNGKYGDLPMSYYQADVWRRINWAAAATVQVATTATAAYVLVPLDGNTSPTHILKFEWAAGITPAQLTPQSILFTLVELPAFFPGAIETVQNVLPNLPANVYDRRELWVGPADYGNLCTDESFDRPEWQNNPGSAWSVVTDANARTGGSVAKRTADGTQSGFIQTVHQIPAYGGQGFYVGAYFKGISSANGNCGISIDFYQADFSFTGNMFGIAANPGTSYTIFWTTGTAPSLSVFGKAQVFADNSVGVTYADDIVVRHYAILRELSPFDTNPYRDNGVPILAEYRTAHVPSRKGTAGQVFKHQVQIYRAYGSGHLLPVVKGLDDLQSTPVRAVTLGAAPGAEERRGILLKAEGASTLFTNNLCRDGGFEASARWIVVSPFAITLDPTASYEGKHCLTHTSGSGSATLVDAFSVTVGSLLYVFCRTKNSSGADGRIAITIRFLDAAGATVTEAYLIPGFSTTWKPWSLVCAVPVNSVTATLIISAGNHTTGTHYLDDIAVIEQDGAWVVSSLTHYFSLHSSSR